MSTQLNGTLELMGLDVEDMEVRGMAMDKDEEENPEECIDEWSDHLFADTRVTNVVLVRWVNWDEGRSEILAERKRP